MRSKKTIQEELARSEDKLKVAEEQIELNRGIIQDYIEKIGILKWVLAEEEPVKTEGTR